MARKLYMTEGAEVDASYWDSASGTSRNTSIKRAPGRASFSISGSNEAIKNINGGLDEFYERRAVYLDTSLSSGKAYLARYRDDTNFELLSVVWDALTNTIRAERGGAVLAISSVALQRATWYCIEIHFIAHATTGEVTVRADEVQILSWTGNTIGSGHASVYAVGSLGTGLYLDDLALNDTSGGVDDSWCGDERIIFLAANDNGDVSQWTGSDADSTDNYLMLDEIPPDNDTTYIEDSTTGHQDMVDVEDFDATGWTVSRAWVEARARGTASGEQIKLGVKSGGSVYLSGAISLLTSYRRELGDDLTTDPATAAAWDNAGLDAVQAVVETV